MRPVVISPIRALALLAGTVICMSHATRPLWSQSAVWLPQGATTGNIYYNGGNVGIGTATPASALDVNGWINARGGLVTPGFSASAAINNASGVRQDFISNTLTGTSTGWFIGLDNWVSSTADYSNSSFVWGIENVLRLGLAGGSGGGTIANAIAQNNVVAAGSGVTVTSARGLDIAIQAQGGTIASGRGIYISQVDAPSDNRWGIYDSSGAPAYFAGNVGIGTTAPQYKLAVNGTIGAKEVIVTTTGWPDYAFKPGYRLRPLSEIDAYVRAHHHLPDVPSEAEVKEKGVSVGDMQAKLLAKIEELTLHMIQQGKENQELRDRVARLESRAAGSGAPAARR